jgi:hypothetical protein
MMTRKSSLEIMGIVSRGGSVELDAGQFSALDFQGIASRLQPGAHVKIHSSDRLSALDCQGIASRAPAGSTVIFA